MLFGKKTFIWGSYTTNKAFSTTKWIWIIDKTKFVIVALNTDS